MLERRDYDDFGKAITIPSDNLASVFAVTPRSFTDHEYLLDVGLIHMNGRVYDYNLGRFLSVDPFIQGAANSQSVNPYSYLGNNPLSEVDPTGYTAETEVEIDTESIGKAKAEFSHLGADHQIVVV